MARVSEVMTRGVRTMAPYESMLLAAQAMEELDIGVIPVPVCDGEKLVGMVTDRDIVLRGVAQGCSAEQTPLSSVMTRDVCWCFEDQSVEEVGEQMREAQICRLPMVDRDKHLVSMLSLGDVATKGGAAAGAQTLEEVSRRSRPDRSGQSAASGGAGGGMSQRQG
jgi:CBS domain-containing protein